MTKAIKIGKSLQNMKLSVSMKLKGMVAIILTQPRIYPIITSRICFTGYAIRLIPGYAISIPQRNIHGARKGTINRFTSHPSVETVPKELTVRGHTKRLAPREIITDVAV